MDEQQPSSACSSCEEYLAGWKRAQADYQNLKRESERERQEYVKYANERLLQELLPAIDQFSTALKFVPDVEALVEPARANWKNWLVGIKAVQSLWEQAAASVGLTRIPTDGAFDPSLHEAVGEEVAESIPSGNIVRISQDGWKLAGKIIRPAKVIIVKEPNSSDEFPSSRE